MIDALIKRVSVTYKCYEMYAHRGKKADAVYQRMIDNTISRRKTTKGQTMIYKTLHIKHFSVLNKGQETY
jgi:hypothetical protein